MDDESFRRILAAFELSWQGYKKVRRGVKKRLVRHMGQLGCRNVDRYLLKLAEDPDLKKQADLILTVTISRFFRDRRLWRDLQEHVLPELTQRTCPPVRVWSAGCACGEEAYSFAIHWETFCDKPAEPPALELLATDVNVEALAKAKSGIYKTSSLKEMDREMRARYFQPLGDSGHWRIDDSIRAIPKWQILDLLEDEPPALGMHIVFLRNNLLTYYQESLQRPALGRIVNSISVGGYLFIGSHEKIPQSFVGLEQAGFNKSIFRKSGGDPHMH